MKDLHGLFTKYFWIKLWKSVWLFIRIQSINCQYLHSVNLVSIIELLTHHLLLKQVQLISRAGHKATAVENLACFMSMRHGPAVVAVQSSTWKDRPDQVQCSSTEHQRVGHVTRSKPVPLAVRLLLYNSFWKKATSLPQCRLVLSMVTLI